MKIARAVLAAAGWLAMVACTAAQADNLTTYDFSGTLATSGSVTGQFTLDGANLSVTAFHFATPLGDVTTATSVASVYTYTPAFSPARNFVEIEILPNGKAPGLNLNFQADTAKLTPISFYPASFHPFASVDADPSELQTPQGCSPCETFTAGAVTVAKPPAPASQAESPLRSEDSSRPEQGPARTEAGATASERLHRKPKSAAGQPLVATE